MRTILVMFTTAVMLLGTGWSALAQGQGKAGGILGDVLNDVLGVNHSVRGNVVQLRESTLVLRGDDERTYTLNTAGLDSAALRRLADGAPVVVTLKNANRGAMPIAASVQPGDGPVKRFRRVEGTVTSVSGDQVTFTTREGMTLTLDRSRIVGEAPTVSANETATLVYEEQPQLAAVWIAAARDIQPSAAVSTGAYERVHGYVQSLAVGALTLRADDGRTLTIDTSQAATVAVKPGDVVTIVGKSRGTSRFTAEVIQPDVDAAPAASPRR